VGRLDGARRAEEGSVADLDAARGRLAAIQAECDRGDLRHTAITPPADTMTKATLIQLCKDNNAFAADIQAGLGLIWEHAAAGLAALADDPPPPPPPPPPAAWNGPAAGFYSGQRYGSGARQWGNLTIPAGVPRGLLIQVHGGGWMQGDPNVAVPTRGTTAGEKAYDRLLHTAGLMPENYYGLRAMASYAADRWHVIVWEPAYTFSTGNPDVCLADVRLAISYARSRLAAWGVPDLPVVYAGHSAGGQLSLRAALDPGVPAPRAWLGMAAAGLTVHVQSDVQDAPGGYGVGGTGWIFNTAWGPASTWPHYAPDSYLGARSERFPLYVEQGNLNNHDDGSVNLKWARDFAAEAVKLGPAPTGAVWPVTYHEQAGADHFAIRWDQSPVTRADMDAIWASV
jgi:acetyl esterase/lipase